MRGRKMRGGGGGGRLDRLAVTAHVPASPLHFPACWAGAVQYSAVQSCRRPFVATMAAPSEALRIQLFESASGRGALPHRSIRHRHSSSASTSNSSLDMSTRRFASCHWPVRSCWPSPAASAWTLTSSRVGQNSSLGALQMSQQDGAANCHGSLSASTTDGPLRCGNILTVPDVDTLAAEGPLASTSQLKTQTQTRAC